MLKSKEKMVEIAMPISQNYHIMCRTYIGKVIATVVMTWLSKQEEKKIDKADVHKIQLARGDRTFNIDKKFIYCYGDIDFSKDEDCDIINNLGFLKYLTNRGISIPSNYNYNKHVCISDTKRYKVSETFNPLRIAKYAHGCLQKPKNIIIFAML